MVSDKNNLEASKKTRKAKVGGRPKLLNIPRNWLHQGLSYMDTGELSSRIIIETLEIVVVYCLLDRVISNISPGLVLFITIVIVHTWNWMTNGLFWALIIFAFPQLKNPGAEKTVDYLNNMRQRLLKKSCITGVAIYGSVTRSAWHDRSDIDIRFLRKPGMVSLICAVTVTMKERFIAFINKQPMDLFLADDIDFLKKMRADEVPVFTICRDKRLVALYPDCSEGDVSLDTLVKSQT